MDKTDLTITPNYKKQFKRLVYSLGKLYTIGPKNCSEGMKVCRTLHGHGIFSTIGKFSKDGDDPAQIVHEYKQCCDSLKSNFVEGSFYLSLKPPAFQFNIDHVKAIAAAALKNGIGIQFDSHDHILAEPTIQLLKHLMDHPDLVNEMSGKWRYGLTLPSRWKRSIKDARWVAKKGMRVRLVKGEFKAIRSNDEMDFRRGFLELVDILTGSVPEIAVATHDYALAKEAIARLKNTDSLVQLELIFGMPTSRMIELSKEMGVSVRFYVPYGDALFLYGLRQFLTNPNKILRPGFREIFYPYEVKLSRIIASL